MIRKYQITVQVTIIKNNRGLNKIIIDTLLPDFFAGCAEVTVNYGYSELKECLKYQKDIIKDLIEYIQI